jgi:cytochrome c553
MTVTTEAQAAALEGYVEVGDDLADKIGKIKSTRKNARGWSEFRDELVKDVKDALDGATGAVHNGRVVATIKHRAGRVSIDRELLKALVDEETYNKVCAACHQVNGQGLPPAFPGLIGSAIVTGDIAAHLDIVLNGKAGTAMQAFGPQLNDLELAAVITYERNAWGNDTGDLVQPGDIAAARGK